MKIGKVLRQLSRGDAVYVTKVTEKVTVNGLLAFWYRVQIPLKNDNPFAMTKYLEGWVYGAYLDPE